MAIRRILLIDTSGLAAENFKKRLEISGFEVELASDPTKMTRAMADRADAVVTEWEAGPLKGGDLIRPLQPGAKPVYVFSDSPQAQDENEWKPLGVRASFSKLRRSELIRLLQDEAAELETPDKAYQFLVVEDSPTVRSFVSHVLGDQFKGSEVREAEDGKSALAAMKTGRVDLIVTDLQMPGMDGENFIQMLHRNPLLQKKPVIVLSGMITGKLREEFALVPNVRFLPKPASPDALAACVRELLR